MDKSMLRALLVNSRRARGRFVLGAMLAGPVVGLAPALIGCSDPETADDGSIRGTLTVYVATMDDGSSRTEYRLLVGGDENDERRLVFDGEPDVTGGSELKIWGESRASELVVDRFEI